MSYFASYREIDSAESVRLSVFRHSRSLVEHAGENRDRGSTAAQDRPLRHPRGHIPTSSTRTALGTSATPRRRPADHVWVICRFTIARVTKSAVGHVGQPTAL